MWRNAAVLCLLVGCGGGEGAAPDAPGAENPDAASGAPDADRGDPSAPLFQSDHVLEVSITLAPSDWELLRNQPDQIGLPEVTCENQPTEEAYTYFSADLTIDGTTVTDIGLRKKGGLGSLSTERPALKVKANEYVPGQRVFGLKKLTLNNNHQDATLISQCLGYGLYAAAGLPASRCSFAHVTVNGEDLGVYSNVETIDEDYLERRFADASGNLYESGGDFVPGGTGSFQPKTNSDAPDCSDLEPVVDALGAPAADLPAELGAVVDLDQFTRYWAMEVLLDHWDGYANNQNNYWFYHDPQSDKFVFLPSGIDALFTGRARTTRPDSVFACGAMPWRMYDVPATRATYLTALRELIETGWDEGTLLAEIDRMQALIEPYADPDGTGALAAAIDGTRAFVASRANTLLSELDAGEPVWPYAAGEPSCRIDIGPVAATFETTWDTLGEFGLGSGETSGTISGIDVASSTVYGQAGISEGKPTVQLLALLPDDTYLVAYLVWEQPDAYVTGTRAIDLVNVASFVTFYDPATETGSGGGFILDGTITMTAASTEPDGPVAGTFSGHVIEL